MSSKTHTLRTDCSVGYAPSVGGAGSQPTRVKAYAPAVATRDELLKHEVAEQAGADDPEIRCKQLERASTDQTGMSGSVVSLL